MDEINITALRVLVALLVLLLSSSRMKGNTKLLVQKIIGNLMFLFAIVYLMLRGEITEDPFFTNDAIVFGILMIVLGLVFHTSHSDAPGWKKFYKYVPALLLCYFIPALLNWPLKLISPTDSKLYYMASRYLLPACLVLLTISIDMKAISNLGAKALIMFFTATLGIIIGGPLALFIVTEIRPDLIPAAPDQIWRGLSAVAGSWIGGGGNQTAMKEIYEVSESLFGTMVIVDVVVAQFWMAFLLYGANITKKIDAWLKADTSAIEKLQKKVEDYRASIERVPQTLDLYILGAVAFGAVAISHWGAELILPIFESMAASIKEVGLNSLLSKFFWIIVIATTVGLLLSFTKFKKLEGVGASKWGSVFIFILVATIGMQMDLSEVWENIGLLVVGVVWMIIHVTLLMIVAKLIKAPFFFVAVGSQANVGGAASAPVMASAFNPALAPVGALLAVLGYAMGTYGAIICAELMRLVVT